MNDDPKSANDYCKEIAVVDTWSTKPNRYMPRCIELEGYFLRPVKC